MRFSRTSSDRQLARDALEALLDGRVHVVTSVTSTYLEGADAYVPTYDYRIVIDDVPLPDTSKIVTYPEERTDA